MPGITGKISKAARARVRARLVARPQVSARAFSELTAMPTHSTLARDLASVIGVDAQYLRREDVLGEILRVHRNELPPDIQPLLARVGLQDVVDPFAFGLLDFVEKRIGEDQSRLKRDPFVPTPKTEDEWIARILSLTFGELFDALT